MRPIKFRAWDKKQNRLLSQEEMNKIGGFYYNNGVEPDEDEFDLMQFTGLLDKNGKEIYEGDLLTRRAGNSKFIYTVVYDAPAFVGVVTTQEKEVARIHVGGMRSAKEDGIEVIGNIYENPDLCKSLNEKSKS